MKKKFLKIFIVFAIIFQMVASPLGVFASELEADVNYQTVVSYEDEEYGIVDDLGVVDVDDIEEGIGTEDVEEYAVVDEMIEDSETTDVTDISATYIEIEEQSVVLVSTWAEFIAAVADNSVSVINISADITATTTAAIGTVARDLTINGNGHTVDFNNNGNGIVLGTATLQNPLTLTLQNVRFVKTATIGTPVITTATGANWTVVIGGNVTTATPVDTNGAGLVAVPQGTVRVQGTGNQLNLVGPATHIHTRDLEVMSGAVININSSGASHAAVRINNNGRVDLRAGASMTISNQGTNIGNAQNPPTVAANQNGGINGSQGLYGRIRVLNMEANSYLNIDATSVAFRSFALDSGTGTLAESADINHGRNIRMVDGAVFTARGGRQAVVLSSGGASTPANLHMGGAATTNNTISRIYLSGVGTTLNASGHLSQGNMGNSLGTEYRNATIRVLGHNSQVDVLNGATINAHSDNASAIQVQGRNSRFNVVNNATINATRAGGPTANNTASNAAVLRFRLDRGQELHIEQNSTINITAYGGLGEALRYYGGANLTYVNSGSSLIINHFGTGEAVNYAGAETARPDGFILSDAGSRVQIRAHNNRAIRHGGGVNGTGSAGRMNIYGGVGTSFILEGRMNGTAAGIIDVSRLAIEVDSPELFDFINHGTGRIFTTNGSDSTIDITSATFAVWHRGMDTAGMPYMAWSGLEFRGRGADFSNNLNTANASFNQVWNRNNPAGVAGTNAQRSGARKFSRMSFSNIPVIIDELRVPTDADMYIHGHISVRPGTGLTRSAWEGEASVSVEVRNLAGAVVFTGTGVTGRHNVYGSGMREGIFRIPFIYNGEHTFIPEGYTVHILPPTNPDVTITATPVTSVRVTPPEPAAIETGHPFWDTLPAAGRPDFNFIMNDATTISGTAAEVGAYVLVVIGNETLETTVMANGTWSVVVPAGLLEPGQRGFVFLNDGTGVLMPNSGFGTLPSTNNAMGNQNPTTSYDFHDATFEAAAGFEIIGGLTNIHINREVNPNRILAFSNDINVTHAHWEILDELGTVVAYGDDHDLLESIPSSVIFGLSDGEYTVRFTHEIWELAATEVSGSFIRQRPTIEIVINDDIIDPTVSVVNPNSIVGVPAPEDARVSWEIVRIVDEEANVFVISGNGTSVPSNILSSLDVGEYRILFTAADPATAEEASDKRTFTITDSTINIIVDDEDGDVSVDVETEVPDVEIILPDDEEAPIVIVIPNPDGSIDVERDINVDLPGLDWTYRIDDEDEGYIIVTIYPPDPPSSNINIEIDEDGGVNIETDVENVEPDVEENEDGTITIVIPNPDGEIDIEQDIVVIAPPGWNYDVDEDDEGNIIITITPTVYFQVDFAVVGAGSGTLVAEVDDLNINTGDEVPSGSDVVFTATPALGYEVLEWRVNGEVVTQEPLFAAFSTNALGLTLLDLNTDVFVTVEFVVIEEVCPEGESMNDEGECEPDPICPEGESMNDEGECELDGADGDDDEEGDENGDNDNNNDDEYESNRLPQTNAAMLDTIFGGSLLIALGAVVMMAKKKFENTQNSV